MDEMCRDEYTMDVIRALIAKEGKRPSFSFQSPQIQERPLLVSWIRQVSDDLNLQSTTFHLALYVLDVFMNSHEIASPQLKLLAIVCLLLAAKFEELDSNIPKISTLKAKMESDFRSTEFIAMELVILKFLDWDLAHPTTAHFVEMFNCCVIQPSDLVCCREKHVNKHSKERMKCNLERLKLDALEIIQDFMDVSFQDISHMKFQPSVIAASIMFITRNQLELQPVWTSLLTEVTGMNIEDIILCSSWLMREMDDDIGKNYLGIDQGYFTNGSSCSSDISPSSVEARSNSALFETPVKDH